MFKSQRADILGTVRGEKEEKSHGNKTDQRHGKMVEIAEGATFADVAKDFCGTVNGPIMLARQKNKLRELHQKIRTCDDVTFYGIENDEAMRVYRRGVLILMTKAVYELWGSESLVVVEHSLQKNLYCEIRKPEMEMTEEVLAKIEGKMREYVAADLPICKRTMRKEDAREIARRQGMPDKDELFRYRRASNVNLYELDGFYDYFYGYMPASTGDLKVFSLMAYENGFLIRFPDQKNPEVLREFSNPKKSAVYFGTDALVPAYGREKRGRTEPYTDPGKIWRPDSHQ